MRVEDVKLKDYDSRYTCPYLELDYITIESMGIIINNG